MTKTCQKGCSLYVNKGSTPNGHSRKRTALITSAFTKPLFSELPYKLCIFTFPQAAASSSYGHLFRVPRMSTYESFHCIAVSCLQLRATCPGCYYACVAFMLPAFVWTSTKNEWNAKNAIGSRAFGPSITRNLITRVLTASHVKLTQSTLAQ